MIIQLTLILGFSVAFVNLAVIGAVLALIAIFRMWVRTTYRFTVRPDSIQTEKLFTQQIDITTPVAHIQSVSAHEGILESLLNVGTLEISTASSHGDHASFVWPHLASSRKIAAKIQEIRQSGAGK